MSNILSGLLGNKAVLNLVLGTIKKNMAANGVSLMAIIPSVVEDGDTPGLEIRQFKGNVVILDGEDAEDYKRFRYAIQHEKEVLAIGDNKEMAELNGGEEDTRL
jgi:hypothetical protein